MTALKGTGFEPSILRERKTEVGPSCRTPSARRVEPGVPSVPIGRWATAAAPGEVRLEWQSLFRRLPPTTRMGPVTASPPMGRRHKTSGERRCRDETAFVPAKQAIPVARDPVIGPVADTPRQQQEYSRPGPAGQAGKNEDHGVGFEICVAIDNGDVSLGAGDIDGETGRQRRPASTLDRDETEPCAGIALNHEPDPPATKYADPVEQDEPIGNVVEAPRHPSLAHPILHRQSV